MSALNSQQSEDARIFAESIIDTIREPLIILDETLAVVSANRAFYRQFQVESSETEGKQIYNLGNNQWDIPKLRELLERIIPENEKFWDYEFEHHFPDIGHRIMLLNARKLEQKGTKRSLILLAIEDVTERVEARRALEASEALYQRLVEDINSIIIELNTDGEITFFNSFSEKMFGYSRDELIGKKMVGTILPEKDSEGTDNKTLIADLLRDPDRFYFNESVGVRKDGQEIWFSWSSRKITDPERNESIILIDGNDITSEREMRRQAWNAYKIINEAGSAIFRLDTHGQILFANQAFVEVVGKQDVEGMKLNDVGLPANMLQTIEEALNTAISKRQEQVGETEYGDRHLLIRVEPEYEKDGQISDFIVFAHDITARRRAEEALRNSEQRFRKAFEIDTVGVLFFDMKSHFLNANDTFLRMIGYDREALERGELHSGLVTLPEWMPRTRQAFQELAETGRLSPYEKQLVRPDGSRWWGLFAGTRLNETEAVKYVIDITERKQIEDQLRQSQKMEAIGRLAGGTAHEFNNMLNVIIGYAEILGSRLDIESTLRNYVQEIQKAAHRSAEVTNQLLAYSRKQMVQPKVIDLNRTIDAQINMLDRIIGENVEIRFYPGEDLWPVRIDPYQVDQILTNLAVNARDAIYNKGQVIIMAGNQHVSESNASPDLPSGDYVRMTFADTGTGMDEDTLNNIFEPYFTTKEVGKGTGLGLATVWGIVKQNNGCISVESEPGKGTTFTIFFPRSQAEVEEEESLQESSAPEGKETILVVEDERQVLNLAEMFLKDFGYNVLKAATPRKAIEIARQNKIDLLLSDVIMPDMNGKMLQVQIERLQPDIRTLFVSGYTDDVIAEKTLGVDESDLIRKPFTVQSLTNKVRDVLDRK